ncbi:hypothetical protein E4U61_006765 [Claviceps capensis]|nr:hypothetical protein E4U61_006765 [Claviceps capensis]
MDMNSNAKGQPPFNGPHRPREPRQPGAGGPDYRRCMTCHLTKPLQDFKSLRVSHYVLRCITCRAPQSGTPAVQDTPRVSGTKRAIGQVDGATPQSRVARRYRPIAPRTAVADYDHHGVLVFHRRGERPGNTPAMQQACRAKVAISRAHRAQARDDLQPSPSQTPPLPDIVRRRQELEALHRRHEEELEALHRRHEEELMAGASPSPTPAIREHMGQRRGRAVSPSPSSPFSRQNKLNGFQDNLNGFLDSLNGFPDNLNGFPDNLNGGESWIGIPAIITWLSSGAFLPQSSHPSTLPPLPTPDADVPYTKAPQRLMTWP